MEKINGKNLWEKLMGKINGKNQGGKIMRKINGHFLLCLQLPRPSCPSLAASAQLP